EILAKIDLTSIPEKDMNNIIIIHLRFEFDSLKMKIHLSRNKYSRTLHIVTNLLKVKFIIYLILNEALGFLSHYCQVIFLGCPFLRNIFSMLHRILSSCSFRTYLFRVAKKDL